MSTLKITLIAAFVFAAPLAITFTYHLRSAAAPDADPTEPLVGKVLFFSSPS